MPGSACQILAETTAYIGLGSNLGDRNATIRKAIGLLDEIAGVKVVQVSELLETDPLGGPAGQRRYLNAVVEINCRFSPMQVMEQLLTIENTLGRVRQERWGPRTIDLDLLLFGNQIIDQPGLTVPHPRMHTRNFVLIPLAQIAPDVIHPVLGKSILQLKTELESTGCE